MGKPSVSDSTAPLMGGMKRDIQLDCYRAAVMIYILAVVHTVYWFGIGSEPLRSFVLIEMPLIFFISGASISVRNKKETLREAVLNRFKRVYIPFFIYSIVLLVIASVLYWLRDSETFMAAFADKKWMDLGRSILHSRSSLNTSHLWFLFPYFIISTSSPLQLRAIGKIGRNKYMVILLALFTITYILWEIIPAEYTIKEWARDVKFYMMWNIFYVAGIQYYKKTNKKCMIGGGIAILSLFILLYSLIGGSMQDYKFSASYMFLIFGIGVIFVFSIIFSYAKIPDLKILRIWNRYGYSIYLYQNIAFFIIAFLCTHMGLHGLTRMATISLGIILSMTFVGPIIGRMENLIIGAVCGIRISGKNGATTKTE